MENIRDFLKRVIDRQVTIHYPEMMKRDALVAMVRRVHALDTDIPELIVVGANGEDTGFILFIHSCSLSDNILRDNKSRYAYYFDIPMEKKKVSILPPEEKKIFGSKKKS